MSCAAKHLTAISLFLLAQFCFLAQGESQNAAAIDTSNRLLYQRNSFRRPFYSSPPFWILGGDAIFNTEKISLAPESRSEGWIWNSVPLLASSWRVQFDVSFDSVPTAGSELAFWYVSSPQIQFNVNAIQNAWRGLGVFVTSCEGDRSLCIRASANIDEYSHHTYQEADILDNIGFCRLPSTYEGGLHLRASYANNVLNLEYTSIGSTQWSTCFTQSVNLPSNLHLAFSAKSDIQGIGYNLYSLESQRIQAAAFGESVAADRIEIEGIGARAMNEQQYTTSERLRTTAGNSNLFTQKDDFRSADMMSDARSSTCDLAPVVNSFKQLRQEFAEMSGSMNKAMSKTNQFLPEPFIRETHLRTGAITEQMQQVHSTTISIINQMASYVEKFSNEHVQLRFDIKTDISTMIVSINRMNEKLERFVKANLQARVINMLFYVIVLQSAVIGALIWMFQKRSEKQKYV